MKYLLLALVLLLAVPTFAAETPEEAATQEKIRAAIPLGGNFQPAQEEGVFVAAGHGLNVVVSRDDGQTWKRVFYGAPCGDHGRWAVWNSVAYTEGVFAIAAGWGAPGTIIATDDGENWRHLTDGNRKSAAKDGKPYDMGTTMQLVGAGGAFIMQFEATPDFGRTWHRTSSRDMTDASGAKVKVNAGHPALAFGAGRVIVVGDAGPAMYSDDLGKTWVPMQVKVEPWEEEGARGIIAKDRVFLLLKGSGATILRSEDKGLTWKSHPLGVERPASRSYSLSVVGDEFWITGQVSKASKDGITWRELPKAVPNGRIAASDKGTLINVERKRNSIVRSTDNGATWTEVYKYTPDPQATGGAQGLADVEFGRVRKIGQK
jgi:photosystem II stability/assembly factor-like uncharacterized protein